jgi:hypothetical protein|tara:strand:- start:34 stop:231 length:198 start_codon:yes stop_codon:yes gene_type:complete
MSVDISNVQTGNKLKVVSTISSSDGVLYKDTIVKIEAIGFPDKDLRVIDPVGKIWYLNFSDVRKI